jgi:hypothetical protein
MRAVRPTSISRQHISSLRPRAKSVSARISVVIYWSANGQALSSLEPALRVGLVMGLVHLVMALLLLFKAGEISGFLSPPQA